MMISANMIKAAQAAAPDVDQDVVIAILRAGMAEAVNVQLSALCNGVARIIAVVDTPQHPTHNALIKASR